MYIDKINYEIQQIWLKYFGDDEEVLAPLIYTEIKKKGFVFVGCNPSFYPSKLRGILRKNLEYKDLDLNDFYSWRRVKNDFENYIEECKKVEGLIRIGYKTYFDVFDKIALELNLPSQGFDMFVYRQGSQTNFKTVLFNSDNYNDFRKLNDFANEQICIFKKLLDESDPQIILIANAFVSDIFKFKFGELLKKNINEDFERYDGKPIFFSSMISGANQLDKHTRQRLIWQMKTSVGARK